MAWIQIIDDDYWCGEAIIAFLTGEFEGCRFEARTSPDDVDDGRDIYIVDNEFGFDDHGVDLVRRIRSRNPDAFIMLCTATRERIDANAAMNAGCNALIPKGSAAGREEMVEMIRRYRNARASSSPSFLGVVSEIKSVLSAWNERMRQDRLLDRAAAS